MDYILQMALGIATGVLTSALLFFLRDTWKKTIRPWLEELRYKGVHVEGTWRGVSHEQDVHTEVTLFLLQKATTLSGSFTFKVESPAKGFVLEYGVSGYIWEGYLTLNFLPKDRAITTSAMALLKIAGGGAGLAGQFCFRNVELEAVTASFITFARQLGPSAQPATLGLPRPPAPAVPPAPVEVAAEGAAPPPPQQQQS